MSEAMIHDPRRVTVRAPAKINLTLELRGRRADGFHELRTHLLALELADELRVATRPGEGVALEVSGLGAGGEVPGDEENLAWRAAAVALAAAREAGLARGVGLTVELVKRIPAQAGLDPGPLGGEEEGPGGGPRLPALPGPEGTWRGQSPGGAGGQ